MARTTWIGTLLIVAGVVAGAVLLGMSLSDVSARVKALDRVPYPAGGTITAEAGGRIVVYAEYPSAVGKGEARPAATIAIEGDAGPVPMGTYDASANYSLEGNNGVAIATADLPGPGSYRVSITPTGDSAGVMRLAIGPSVLSATNFVLPLVGGILLFIGGLVAGVLTIVLPRRRRRRAAAAVTPAAYPPPPSPPPPPPGR